MTDAAVADSPKTVEVTDSAAKRIALDTLLGRKYNEGWNDGEANERGDF